MNRVLDGLSSLNSQYDILVMGESGVGKTSLVQRYVNGTFSEGPHEQSEQLYVKAIDHETAEIVSTASSHNSDITEISILDSSSLADVYGASRMQQVKNTSTILFVYAMDDRESFEALEYLIGTVKTLCDGELPPFVIAAAKEDRYEYCQVWYDDGEAMAKRVGAIGFFSVSALSDTNVNKCFVPLVDAALEAREHRALHNHIEVQSVAEVLSTSASSSFVDSTPEKTFNFRRPSKIPSSLSNSHGREPSTSPNYPVLESFASDFPEIPESITGAETVNSPTAREPSSNKEHSQTTSSVSTGSIRSQSRTISKPKEKKEKSGCCIIT
ncbi:hypothetical protein FDK38_002677 [Candidozyma auris]|nr:hypothetical protein FDK38_002677 [[Candida] auris]